MSAAVRGGNWVDDVKRGMENALRPKPLNIAEQYGRQILGLRSAYAKERWFTDLWQIWSAWSWRSAATPGNYRAGSYLAPTGPRLPPARLDRCWSPDWIWAEK